MPKFARIFLWGLLISFIGTLPLGTLNVAALQISITNGILQAIYFALGCLVVEMFYVRVSLLGMDWVMRQQKLMKILDWLTFLIMVLLAVGSFIAASKGGAKEHGNFFLQSKMHKFLLGATMSAINPVQIPFWFGWSTVLFGKGILQKGKWFYNIYILGIGIGTLLGNCLFIFGGRWLVNGIKDSELYLNWIIGGIFAITALIQLYRILTKKDTFEQLEEKQHQH